MSGWVLIHRDVWLSDGFEDEPFSQREAWIWMIAHAAWKDTTQRFKGQTVTIKRGQLFYSIRNLADILKWSKSRVARFLAQLEGGGMIGTESGTESGTSRSVITICKYDVYQFSPENTGQDAGQDAGQSWDTKERKINNNLSSLRSDRDAGASSDDPKDILFTKVLDWLKGHGRTEAHCRSMIGRWLKTHPPPDVLAACREAQANKPAEPIAYITKVLTDGQADKTEFRSSDRIVAEILARRERRAAEQGLLPGAASDDVVVLPAVLRG